MKQNNIQKMHSLQETIQAKGQENINILRKILSVTFAGNQGILHGTAKLEPMIFCKVKDNGKRNVALIAEDLTIEDFDTDYETESGVNEAETVYLF